MNDLVRDAKMGLRQLFGREQYRNPRHRGEMKGKHSVLHDLHHFLGEYGYWALALLIGLESMGLPLPGETVLVIASVHAANRQDGNIAAVIAAASAGAIIGDNIGYVLGRELGFRFLLRFGRYVGETDARIKLGQYLFMRHGAKVVFFGRFVAILRCLAAFLAVNQMPWARFLLANAAGAVVWASVIGLGAFLFRHSLSSDRRSNIPCDLRSGDARSRLGLHLPETTRRGFGGGS